MRDEEISSRLRRQMDAVHVPPDLLRKTLMKTVGKEEPEMKKKFAFSPVLAIAILIISICTALAAEFGFFWNHPLESELEIDDTNREKYQSAHLLAAPGLSQTHGGITISTDQCVVDEHTAYISFRISGWDLAEGDEPGFDIAKCSLGLNRACSISSAFACIWSDEAQAEIYADNDGNLVYCFYISTLQESLLGRPIHIELGNPGIYRKDKSLEIDVMAYETWTFDWELTGTEANIRWEKIEQPIGKTEWILRSFSLTPVIAIVTLTPPASLTYDESVEDKIPYFLGVMMMDGTEIRLSGMGGREVYENSYREIVSLNHIIGDLENVREILFSTRGSKSITHVRLPEANVHAAE